MSKCAFAGTSDPTKKLISFVLTDFEPNKNGVVIPEDEVKNIVETAKYKPVKVHFDGEKVGGHEFATPIGVISDVVIDDLGRIIASAVLWSQENDTFIRWMEERADSVFFSWEVVYDQEKQNEPGLREIRNVFISGVAIVENPAYGKRTKLIYFAEEQPKELLMPQKPEEEKSAEAEEQTNSDATVNSADTPDTPEVGAAPVAQEITISEQELTELYALREFYENYQEEQRKQKLLTARQNQLGDDSLFLRHKDFILSLDDEQFSDFVTIVNSLKTKIEMSEDKQPSQQGVIPLAVSDADHRQALIRLIKNL